MSTQPSPKLTQDHPTPFDEASEVLAPGVRQACAPPPGVGYSGPGQHLSNGALIELLQGDVQWLRRTFQVRWQPCRRGRRVWMAIAPTSGYGKTHFFNSLAQRLDGDAVVVALNRGADHDGSPFWERAALGALVKALDRAEAGGARAPASPVGDRAAMPAIESHWTALARSVLAGAVRELLAASADRAADETPAAQRLREAARGLPPDLLQRTSQWQTLLDHVLARPPLLDAVADALGARGIVTNARLRTWLNVFHTLLFADDLELRAACRRWIGGRSVAAELCDQMGVEEGDRLALEGDGEIARQQALERIADLSHFAAFYVPFVLCVEHHETIRSGDGGEDATGRSRRPLPREQNPLTHMLEALAPSLAHAVLVAAMDEHAYACCAAQWSVELRSQCRAPVPLEGLGPLDAQRLLDARLRRAATSEATSRSMVGDGAWLKQLLADGERSVSAREFLEACAARYRSACQGSDGDPVEGAPAPSSPAAEKAIESDDSAAAPMASFEAAWEAAHTEVGEPEPVDVHDALVPLLKSLGDRVYEAVRLSPGDPPLTQLSWEFDQVRYGIAVGIPDTRQRWGQLARRALLGERAVTVCLRLPREMVVPNPAWPVATSMLERAIGAGKLRVVRLDEDQCRDIATAALLLEQLEPRLDDSSRQRAWELVGERLGWLSRAVLEPAREAAALQSTEED